MEDLKSEYVLNTSGYATILHLFYDYPHYELLLQLYYAFCFLLLDDDLTNSFTHLIALKANNPMATTRHACRFFSRSGCLAKCWIKYPLPNKIQTRAVDDPNP